MRSALAEHGIVDVIVETESSARTAQEAADAVSAEIGQIVKSLVFLCDGAPVMALVSGSNQLDEAKLSAIAGGAISRANADGVRAATGFAIGGVAPLGLVTALPLYCDEHLLRYDEIWAAAGTPTHEVPIAPARLVEITGAQVCSLARE